MDEKERSRALGATLSQIEKQFGKGSVIRMGAQPVQLVPSISSGSISVDFALGVGGFPRGRISEVFGPESSGKTTVALQVVAEAQKVGGMAAYIDVEHALDPAYARKLGVDVDNLLVSQPDYGEQALEITNALITSGSIDVLVVDSVAALVPKAELDGEMGDSHMGVHARLMSQAMRKLTGIVSKSNIVPGDLHQPDSRKDRGDVRESGDDHRWTRAEVLFQREDPYLPHRGDQGRRGGDWEPNQVEGPSRTAGPAVSKPSSTSFTARVF